MAYQQQGGLGHGAIGGGPGESHGPQGTEYTLQGVMRYLQIEWHNHERARNAWDIERAEMKAKIAKQEGECRQAKRINEQLDRQVRMLELALRNERAKSKTVNEVVSPAEKMSADLGDQKEIKSQDEPAAGPEELSKSGDKQHRRAQTLQSAVPESGLSNRDPAQSHTHNSSLDTDGPQEPSEKERDQYLDNTTKYLKNCMKEIQYLLTPPQHPPPQQLPPNGNISGLPEPPLPMEDIYARQQQRNSRQQGQVLPQQSSMPIHQPPPVPNSLPQGSGAHEDPRGLRYPPEYSNTPSADLGQQDGQHMSSSFDEPVETVTHSYDARGRPVPEQEAQQHQRSVRQMADADGWTFDEEPPIHAENQAPDVPPPRRPDTDLFPSAASNSQLPAKSPPRSGPGSHRRKSSGSQPMSRRRSSQGKAERGEAADAAAGNDPSQFKVKFALRGHVDVVRSVIFSGGGSPSEPEVCSAGDDGTIKRWIVPATYQNFSPASNNPDLDIQAYFTHRGHEGVVTSLAACPASTGFSTGGRANGDGWLFSGGQDATIRVWERGRVDPKATLDGHTDAIWCVCVLPVSVGVVFGPQSSNFGGPDRLLLVSGSADGTIKIWAVSSPPQTSSPSTGSRRGVGGSRRHSVTSGSNFPSSPQPSMASSTAFNYTLVHSIERPANQSACPTSICPLSPTGETFVVSYTDASVLVFDTRTGEEIIGMTSESYDGTRDTGINAVVATSLGLEAAGAGADPVRTLEGEEVGAGATGSREGVEGVVISGHEDRLVRFFDANSGQNTYNMIAHQAAIAALALSKDGREAVTAAHDGCIRVWSLEKRSCTQDIVSHRAMRGEGVCDVSWSQDGRLVVSAGGDGVVKVFAR